MHRRQLVTDAGDGLGVRVLDEQHGRLGIGDDAAPLARREAIVEEREAHAGHRHPEVGVDELRPILRQDRHSVAGCGDREQGVGETLRPGVQGGERDLCVVEDDGSPLPVLVGTHRHDISEQHAGEVARAMAQSVS